MSIALSVTLRASRRLRVTLAAYGAACAGAAVALATWQAALYCYPYLMAAACLAAALAAWHCAMETENARQIDISGPGEIRVSVQQSLRATRPRSDALALLPGSTVWPSLLIVLLRDSANGTRTSLVILPDSVAAGQFRKLAVAIKSIAGRDNKFSENNKIL